MSSHTVIVNSRNMILDSTTNRNSGVMPLERPIYVPKDHEAWCHIQDAQIPNTFYNFAGKLTLPVRYNFTQSKTVTATNSLTNRITLNNTNNMYVGGTLTGFSATFGSITATGTTYTIQSIVGNDVTVSPALVAVTTAQQAIGTGFAATGFSAANDTVTLFSTTGLVVGDQIQFNFPTSPVTSAAGAGYAITSMNTTTDLITLFSTTDLRVGDQIQFNFGSPYNGVDNTVFYYVISIAGNDIQISTTFGGTALDLTGTTGAIAAGTTVVRFNNGLSSSQFYYITSINGNDIQISSSSATGTIVDIQGTSYAVATTLKRNSYTGGTITATAQTRTALNLDFLAAAQTNSNYNPLQIASNMNGKTAVYNDGVNASSTLTLSIDYYSEDATLATAGTPATRPQLVGKFRTGITAASAGTLANFEIYNFTNVLLGYDNQTIAGAASLGTNNLASNAPYTQTRYLIVNSTLQTGAQAPGLNRRTVILAKIPLTVSFGYIENYRAMIPFMHKLREPSIQSINFQLVDEFGNDVSFNGADWCLTLIFEFHRIKNINPAIN